MLVVTTTFVLAAPLQAAEESRWKGFYSGTTKPPSHKTQSTDDVCLNAILKAQARHKIPDNLLLAIGIQEAGRKVEGRLTVWPWTGNANGQGGFFATKAALKGWVVQSQSRGTRSIDVGCMQVNQRWHAGHFTSWDEAADPIANADYAARFLRKLFHETGDWWEAAGRYHSSTHDVKARYLKKLVDNHKLAKAHVRGATLPAADVPTAQDRSLPAIGWSADISGSAHLKAGNHFSIYSPQPIEPLIDLSSGG